MRIPNNNNKNERTTWLLYQKFWVFVWIVTVTLFISKNPGIQVDARSIFPWTSMVAIHSGIFGNRVVQDSNATVTNEVVNRNNSNQQQQPQQQQTQQQQTQPFNNRSQTFVKPPPPPPPPRPPAAVVLERKQQVVQKDVSINSKLSSSTLSSSDTLTSSAAGTIVVKGNVMNQSNPVFIETQPQQQQKPQQQQTNMVPPKNGVVRQQPPVVVNIPNTSSDNTNRPKQNIQKTNTNQQQQQKQKQQQQQHPQSQQPQQQQNKNQNYNNQFNPNYGLYDQQSVQQQQQQQQQPQNPDEILYTIQLLQHDLDVSLRREHDLLVQYDTLTSTLVSLEQRERIQTQQLDILTERFMESENEKAKQSNELSEYRANCTTQGLQIATLEGTIEEWKTKCTKLTELHEEDIQRIKELKKKVKQSNLKVEELAFLIEEHRILDEEGTEDTKKKNEKKKGFLAWLFGFDNGYSSTEKLDKTELYQTARSTLLSALQNERSSVQELETLVITLQSNCTRIKEEGHAKDSIIDKLKQRIQIFDEDKLVLKAALRQLQKELNEEIPKSIIVEKELNHTKHEIHRLNEEITSLMQVHENTILQVQEEIVQKNEKIQTLNMNLTTIGMYVNKLEERLADYANARRSLKETTEKRKVNEKYILEIKNETMKYRTRLLNSTKERNQLKIQLQNITVIHNEFIRLHQETIQERDELKKSEQALRQAYAKLSIEAKELQNEKNTLFNQCSTFEQNINVTKSANEQLQYQKDIASAEVTTLRNQLDSIVVERTNVQEKLQQLEKEKGLMQQNILRLQDSLIVAEKHVKDGFHKIHEMEKTCATLENTKKKQIQEFSEEFIKLAQEAKIAENTWKEKELIHQQQIKLFEKERMILQTKLQEEMIKRQQENIEKVRRNQETEQLQRVQQEKVLEELQRLEKERKLAEETKMSLMVESTRLEEMKRAIEDAKTKEVEEQKIANEFLSAVEKEKIQQDTKRLEELRAITERTRIEKEEVLKQKEEILRMEQLVKEKEDSLKVIEMKQKEEMFRMEQLLKEKEESLKLLAETITMKKKDMDYNNKLSQQQLQNKFNNSTKNNVMKEEVMNPMVVDESKQDSVQVVSSTGTGDKVLTDTSRPVLVRDERMRNLMPDMPTKKETIMTPTYYTPPHNNNINNNRTVVKPPPRTINQSNVPQQQQQQQQQQQRRIINPNVPPVSSGQYETFQKRTTDQAIRPPPVRPYHRPYNTEQIVQSSSNVSTSKEVLPNPNVKDVLQTKPPLFQATSNTSSVVSSTQQQQQQQRNISSTTTTTPKKIPLTPPPPPNGSSRNGTAVGVHPDDDKKKQKVSKQSKRRFVPFRKVRKVLSKTTGIHGVFTKPSSKSSVGVPLTKQNVTKVGRPTPFINATNNPIKKSSERVRANQVNMTRSNVMNTTDIKDSIPQRMNLNSTTLQSNGTPPMKAAAGMNGPKNGTNNVKKNHNKKRIVPFRSTRKLFAKLTGLHGVFQSPSITKNTVSVQQQQQQQDVQRFVNHNNVSPPKILEKLKNKNDSGSSSSSSSSSTTDSSISKGEPKPFSRRVVYKTPPPKKNNNQQQQQGPSKGIQPNRYNKNLKRPPVVPMKPNVVRHTLGGSIQYPQATNSNNNMSKGR